MTWLSRQCLLHRQLGEGFHTPYHARAFNMALHEHKANLRQITDQVHENYYDELEDLGVEHCRVVEQYAAFHRRAEEVFDRISDHLTQVDVPEFKPPEPRPTDEPSAPLFDARRGYVTQLDHYRAWQGRSNNQEAD